jgi:hypothetical protein
MRQVSAVDRTCHCGSSRRLHDYRTRQVDTLFGRVVLRQPKSDHARRPSRASALIGGRATPELVRVQAELGARLSFREAARMMSVLLPTGKAANHTGIRLRLARTCGSSARSRQCQPTSDEPRRSRSDGDCPRRRAHPGCSLISGPPLRSHGRACGNGATANPALRRCSELTTSRSRAIGNALRSRGWLPGRDVTVLRIVIPRLSRASVP